MKHAHIENARAYCPHEKTITPELPDERGISLGSSYWRMLNEHYIDRIVSAYMGVEDNDVSK